MSTMMDIIFATIMGGVIVLIVLNANALIRETWSVYNGDVMVQNMMVQTAQIVEGEFRNMGTGLSTNDTVYITVALDTCISFRMDLSATGTSPDTITYYAGATSDPALASTPNPLDRFLYRRQSSVNGGAAQPVGVVTQFNLKYFDRSGNTILAPVVGSNRGQIKIVEITMEIQNPYAIYRDPSEVKPGESNALYSTSLWKQTRLASPNLNR